MLLKDIARNQIITIQPGDSIDDAIATMEQHGIRHLPVIDEDQLVGMISDRDILSAVGWLSSHDRISDSEGPSIIGPKRISEIMSAPVHSLHPDESIETAGRLMLEEKISAVPLVREGALVGMVTETDFLLCYVDDRPVTKSSSWRFEKVREHMTDRVFMAKASAVPYTAFRMMHQKKIRHLPVIDDKNMVVGMVSDRDVRKAFFQGMLQDETSSHAGPQRKLGDIMSVKVESIDRSSALNEAADRMLHYKIGALPVTHEGKVFGIITETDLLRVLVDTCTSGVDS